MTLKPYTGPHAEGLYHVVDDEGRVLRNASDLEVILWKRLNTLIENIEALSSSTMRDAKQLAFSAQIRNALNEAKVSL